MDRGVAQPGSAPASGAGGRWFKSSRPDQTSYWQIGVVGGGEGSPPVLSLAEEVGERIAAAGAILVCGGLRGVMEASARGAHEGGGLTVGILPGGEHGDANPFIDVRIVTNLGEARNVVVVRSSHAIIALPGEYGTLSEVALALKIGVPVVGLGSWTQFQGVASADTAEEAVALALQLAQRTHVRGR